MLAYKFQSGNELHLKALSESYFWAASIESLNDPCEALCDINYFKPQFESIVGFFQGTNSSEAGKTLESIYSSLDKLFLTTRKCGIFSLSKNNLNEVMWAHYADAHKGYCVEIETDFLTKDRIYDFNLLEVVYEDKPAKIEMDDIIYLKDKSVHFLQKIIATKPKKWELEEEIRLVTNKIGEHYFDFRAIKSVYFGFRIEEKRKLEIMERLAGRNVKYYQMNLQVGTYKFFPESVEDLFEASPKYLYHVAPVEEGTLENALSDYRDKPKFKQFLPYLHKAIEVARREPYCKEVVHAGFSSYKGTLENPVIFVQHMNLNGEYKNFDYTIEELEKHYSEITDLG